MDNRPSSRYWLTFHSFCEQGIFMYGGCEHPNPLNDIWLLGSSCSFENEPTEYSCGGIPSQDPEVCTGSGECVSQDECLCLLEADFEPMCAPSCFGILYNESSVCSSHGNCALPNVCECDEFYSGSNCSFAVCGEFWSNDPNVCSGSRGKCLSGSHGICDCYNVSEYWGDQCQTYKCFGILSNETTQVCSGHGDCVSHNNCTCLEPYNYTTNCDEWKCYGIWKDEKDRVCSGHGTCIESDICNCTEEHGYSGKNCEIWKCFEFRTDEPKLVCSSHGICEDVDLCNCTNDLQYGGKECQDWKCFSHERLADQVCGRHGHCIAFDQCDCDTGYFNVTFDSPCSVWKCGDFLKSETTQVCSNRGSCGSPETCVCSDGFEGSNCESWSCGYSYMDSRTCSGNGKCLSPDTCECDGAYSGEKCETNILYGAVMAPVLSLVGIVSIGVVLSIIFLILCCCCVLVLIFVCSIFVFCCAMCFLCLLICSLFLVTCALNLRVKKFGKLRNFDILLKEQEMEDDSSVAHVRINTSLFEIDMKELKLEKVLGEGGSQSTVYRAKWRNQVVAFKCFKTRMICQSQPYYDEFESEVNVLASISHPNVIRYFGSSLEAPRVGIVMEFCENGDVSGFLKRYNVVNGTSYSYEEKLRMILETCRAMEYLHSRHIIHRDLKLENVLVDANECCKLMDFGLSKIVDRMSQLKTTRIGTGIYMSPEIVSGGQYSEKTDVFSMSIFMFIVLTENFRPYGGEQHTELRVASDPELRPDLDEVKVRVPRDHQDWLCGAIGKCWSHEPDERLEMGQICDIIEKQGMNTNEKSGLGGRRNTGTIYSGSDRMKKKLENIGRNDSNSNETPLHSQEQQNDRNNVVKVQWQKEREEWKNQVEKLNRVVQSLKSKLSLKEKENEELRNQLSDRIQMEEF